MGTGWVHNFNPVIASPGGITLYYYGMAYAIGFIGIHCWLYFRRKSLGWTVCDVYDFSILFAVCVLLMGRLFSVFVYHWPYYRTHLHELFHYWQGGMATHGVLLGGIFSLWLYARWRNVSFLRLADEVVIPAAVLLALGRIGNFINGQICGTVTSVWWAVQFPQMDGFRHPVTVYESLKNLTLIPILLHVSRKHKPGQGQMAAHFVFWYGFLRLFTDIFRDHGAQLFGIGRNQYFNALMAGIGLILMLVFSRLNKSRQTASVMTMPVSDGAAGAVRTHADRSFNLWGRRGVLVLIVLFSLVIRSAWNPVVLEQRRKQNLTNMTEIQSENISEHETMKGKVK